MNAGELIDELCEVLTSNTVNIDRVRQLIDAGAYPDENAMSFAINTGKLEIVKSLVDAGADVNYIDDEFYTPLRYAKEALLRIGNGEDDEVEGAEYEEIISYLEDLSSQETKDIVEEIMRSDQLT